MPPPRNVSSVVAAAACLLTGSCSDETLQPKGPPIDRHAFEIDRSADAGPAGPTEKERAVAELYAASLGSPGFPGLLAQFDSDVHLAFPGMTDARGRDAVLRAHEALFGAFDPRSVVPVRVLRTASEQTL